MTLVENLLPVAPLIHGVGPESRHARRSKLRIGICSTYAPRACGLATFAADLERALLASPDVEAVTMLALDNGESPLPARRPGKLTQAEFAISQFYSATFLHLLNATTN